MVIHVNQTELKCLVTCNVSALEGAEAATPKRVLNFLVVQPKSQILLENKSYKC